MRGEYERRAAAVLLELDARAHGDQAGEAATRAETRPARRRPSAEASARRRLWRPVLAGAFLLVFGVMIGVFLVRGIRPRVGPMDSLTGDFLTGTCPGGVSPALSVRGTAVERNLAEGRAAFERGDLRMAIDHFKGVLEVEPNHATALGYLGMILWRGGHADAALEVVERALGSVPGHPLALWTKGLVLYEGKADAKGAIEVWEALMRQPLAPADADNVARMIAEARRQGPAAAGRAAGSAAPATAGDDRREIAGTVVLAEGARGEAPSGGALFVIARRGAGPPVAVKRIVDPKFPVRFTLGPEDVMVQGAELAGEVTLIARLKRDGRAAAAVRGDLEGVAPGSVAVGTTDARITLEAVR